jgi:5'(3')-deoxyribonucleotidase
LAKRPGTELVCVTAVPSNQGEEFQRAKREWLARYIPILANSVVFAKRKSGLGLNVLIDDGPEHFKDSDFVGVLVERPWNSKVRCGLRFREWADAPPVLARALEEAKRKIDLLERGTSKAYQPTI